MVKIIELLKTIAIIPARGGSKRLKGKNVKLLSGIPLLVYSINYAKANSNIIDEVYVSTDNEEIKAVALAHGAKVIDRPETLSGDEEPTITTLQHAISVLNHIETIILLQPTNPLRPESLLKEAYSIYKSKNYDSVFTVSRDHKKLGKIHKNTFQPFNYTIGQRSQDLEPLYFENGLLYITKASAIKKGNIITENAFPLVVNHVYSKVDIDTIEDFNFAEFILKNHDDE